uniref:Telomere repeat binding bouquet formation protein 2 n=1 Tax=Mastacembelus armatus TaxID=205130 RepID=A0A3Q3KTG6_9TELE
MFTNKSAWFSSSVPQACHDFWIQEGGIIAGWKTADYLFSEDATCPDTVRIFESKDYLWNKVTVFHCLFLSACEKRHSVKSVCIGHYVLPPVSVQDGEGYYCILLSFLCVLTFPLFSVVLFTPGYVSMDNLQKYSGDLCDIYPVCFQCSNHKVHA